MARSPSTQRRALHPAGMRNANRSLVLEALRHQPLSRAEAARRTGLSEGTVSRIAGQLMDEGLIVEEGSLDSTGGRPGTRLQLNDARLVAVGIEVQNWETRVSLGTVSGRILQTVAFRTPSSPRLAMEEAARQCLTLVRETPPVGIGLAIRGVVDHRTGTVLIGTQSSWNGFAAGEQLRSRLNVPVWAENNVRAAALAEFHLGSAELKTTRSLIYVRVDEGVGAAMVLEGELLRGPHQAAGELGQMVVADSPGTGRQDRPGCLESLASDPAICEAYVRMLPDTERLHTGGTASRLRLICRRALEGDEAARGAIADAGRFLGIGLANLVWAFDADAIIIDGVVTEAWRLMSEAIRQQFPAGSELPFHNLVLRPGALGPDAPLIGALLLPFQPLFATGHLAKPKLDTVNV